MSKWTKHVTNYFRNMRKTNKNYKFKQAMTDARASYKKMSGGEGDDTAADTAADPPPSAMNKETVGGKRAKLDLGDPTLRAAALGTSAATAAGFSDSDTDDTGDSMKGGRRKKMASSKKSKKGGKKSSKNGRKTAKKYGKK